MRDDAGKLDRQGRVSKELRLYSIEERGSLKAFKQTILDNSLCSSRMGPGLATSKIGTRSSLDNGTEPALQPRDDIPISILIYIVQQTVIIVATSREENYILDQI